VEVRFSSINNSPERSGATDWPIPSPDALWLTARACRFLISYTGYAGADKVLKLKLKKKTWTKASGFRVREVVHEVHMVSSPVLRIAH